ncbi:TetR/AcrR family transcriptional regulator [Amycolatopsis sp. SID8362]|uniref:TetR/AcrR family transcriptional regulator n=1 Tax=Amycolatopsis sp. SID8362 TaxID=2690346 RepID=UPI00136D37B8|nr:TetR/AcrR family transcriptional regulator [Amycolatopsis sp. SID8362]NBH01802.1 TetR family transcriptional regulator [Amycolatopsis sp. SID8362]NED38504.1 TetR/AcrR family transcriptional regulator [Amycolatopsis sp. SID8362]
MSTEDLTARARIRDAAIRLFTARGMEKTSILDIAEEAGVSGGLIRHHFGSKDGLREACDAHVFDELLKFKEDVLAKGAANPGFLPSFDARQLLYRRYLGRALIDGSEAAAAQFTEIVDGTERYFREQGMEMPDPRGVAAALAAMTGGLMILQDHVARVLGEEPGTHEAMLRMSLAAGHLFLNPLGDGETLEKAREALAAYERKG